MFLAACCALSLSLDPAPFSRSFQTLELPAAAKAWFDGTVSVLPAVPLARPVPDEKAERGMLELARKFDAARVLAIGASGGAREPLEFARAWFRARATGDGQLVFVAPVDEAWAMDVERALQDAKPLPDTLWSETRPGPWTWPSARDFFEWMHARNTALPHKNTLHFAGTEYRWTQRAAMTVTEYLGRVDSYGNDRIIQLLAALRHVDSRGLPRYSSMSDDWKDSVHQILPDLEAVLDGRKEQYIKDLSEREWNDARRCTRVLVEAEAELHHEPKFARGTALAANVSEALAGMDDKARAIVLFDVEELPGADVEPENAWPAALRSAVGKNCLVALGFAGRGEITRDAGSVGLSEVPAPSLESMFATLAKDPCLVDLRTLPAKGDVRDWWQTPRKARRGELTTGKPGVRDLATVALGRDVDVVLWWPSVSALAN